MTRPCRIVLAFYVRENIPVRGYAMVIMRLPSGSASIVMRMASSGQQLLDFFRPLDYADVAAVKILFIADVESLGSAFYTVEIEVVDVFSAECPVLVHQREGGAGHRVVRTQLFHYFGGESGLARAHAAEKGYYPAVFHLAYYLVGSLRQRIHVVQYDAFHLYCFLGVSSMYGTIISSMEMPPCWNVWL